jgi:integrase
MASFEKNKSSGLWTCRFRETDENGNVKNRRLSGKYKTKKEAQYAYEDYLAAKAAEPIKKEEQPAQKPRAMLFDDLVVKYMQYQKGRIKEGSYYDIAHKIASRITPFFSGMRADEIKPIDVLEWQQSLEEYSYKYRKTLHGHLVGIYNYAEKYHDIPNVMKKADPPRNLEVKKEMSFWTPEEFSAFIECVDAPEYEMFFRFLFATGCRRGEALAITWADLDLKKCTVRICKSVNHKIVGEHDKPYKVTTPKNEGSNRTIPMPTSLRDVLAEYKKGREDAAFVFGGEDPLSPTNIARTLKNAAEKAGVKRIRIHDFRHSCASILISHGVSIVAVSRHLGHANTTQTLDTYSHMMPDDTTMIRNALNSI